MSWPTSRTRTMETTQNTDDFAPNDLQAQGAELSAAASQQADVNARFSATCLSAQAGFKTSLVERLRDWVDGTSPPLTTQEEVLVFLSKKAHERINKWLMNKRLAVLEPLSPTRTGVIVVSRSGVAHVRNGRTIKDGVTVPGVVELLGQLFAYGSPKFANNPAYPGQLVMLDETYKAAEPAARGESPVAALSYQPNPMPHLRLETAYWARPAKIQTLLKGAL